MKNYAEAKMREFFDTVNEFFHDKENKVMILHMSSFGNHKTSFVATSGIIDHVFYSNGTGLFNEGFQVQLKERTGRFYSDTEKFFGTFDYFEIEEKAFSDTLRVQYKDGSYFIIEVRI